MKRFKRKKWIFVAGFGLYGLTTILLLNCGSNTTEETQIYQQQNVFVDYIAQAIYEKSNVSANFPVNIQTENCFEKLHEVQKQNCSFDTEKCYGDSAVYMPDFTLNPWHSQELQHHAMLKGSWAPCDCKANSVIALIIPYRFRSLHLNIFLNNIIPFLQYQRQAFSIFVVEHSHDVAFNRGASFNAAYREIAKMEPQYDCFIIHDVDMVNENLCNFYQCGTNPRHLSVNVQKMNYILPYSSYVGGVVAMRKTVVKRVNGFTNILYGWGGEDDNLYARFAGLFYTIDRYSDGVGRYASLQHAQAENFNRSFSDVRSSWVFKKDDGLSNLNYSVIGTRSNKLFNYFLFHIPGPSNQLEERQYYKDAMQELKHDSNIPILPEALHFWLDKYAKYQMPQKPASIARSSQSVSTKNNTNKTPTKKRSKSKWFKMLHNKKLSEPLSITDKSK